MAEKSFRTNSYNAVKQELLRRLGQTMPAYCQMISGPRQVGKTTLLLEVQATIGDKVIYVAADSQEADLPGWWENLWQTAKRQALQKEVILLIDEIHYLANWSRLLKAQLDEIKRKKTLLQVVISGSSALKLGTGAKESLSGRFERLPLSHWSFAEMRGLSKTQFSLTIDDFVRTGGYPGGAVLWHEKDRWKQYIRDSIVEPAIGRDVMALELIRRPALLRQVFAIAVGHPAEIISVQKLAGLLTDSGVVETVAHYLNVLEEVGLIAPLKKYSKQVIRQKSSPPKLVVLNQGILGALHQEWPTPQTHPKEWGRWVENACLAHAYNSSQEVYYWRQEPLEVDMVLKGSWGQWAVEVKTGRWDLGDIKGIMTFCEQNSAFRPMLLCDEKDVQQTQIPGLVIGSWQEFLSHKGIE